MDSPVKDDDLVEHESSSTDDDDYLPSYNSSSDDLMEDYTMSEYSIDSKRKRSSFPQDSTSSKPTKEFKHGEQNDPPIIPSNIEQDINDPSDLEQDIKDPFDIEQDINDPSDIEQDIKDPSDLEGDQDSDVEDYAAADDVEKHVEHSSDDEYSTDDTTLRKPVLYQGIHKEEEKEIKIAIERMKPCFPRPDSHGRDRALRFINLIGHEFGERQFITGPVLQVFAIRLNNPSTSDMLNIYGEVSITDDKNNTFSIYKRSPDCPEEVIPGKELSLNGCTILPVMWGNLRFNLMDGGGNVFARNHPLEYSQKYKHGYIRKLLIRGRDGHVATMLFTIIPYALIVRFGMRLFDARTFHGEDKTFNVYGKIKANGVVCFEKSCEEPLGMRHGVTNYIEPYSPVLAVPLFSPLQLDVSLYSQRTKVAYEDLEIHYRYVPSDVSEFICYNERFRIGACVEWFLPSRYFLYEKPLENVHLELSPDDHPQVNLPPKYPVVVYKNVESACVLMDQPPVVTPDHSLVEVFSVLVDGHNTSAPLALCGSIVVVDGSRTFYIFSRNKGCPDKLPSTGKRQFRRSVSLAWPSKRCVVEKDFFMHFKLKDDQNNEVCRGALQWYDRFNSFQSPGDERICAIIQGKNGYYAAVHFSVFKNGLQAKVTVECSKNGLSNSGCVSIYGSVFSEYINVPYHSTYDKKYYRSSIFRRSMKDPAFVKNGSKLPLSKSMVSAPSNCQGLVVDIELWVKSSCGVGHAKVRIPFEVSKNGSCDVHNSEGGKDWICADCCITVKVEWVPIVQE